MRNTQSFKALDQRKNVVRTATGRSTMVRGSALSGFAALADASPVVQRLAGLRNLADARGAPVQRVLQLQYERLFVSAAPQITAPDFAHPERTTVVIEVMIPTGTLATAKAFIDSVAGAVAGPLNLALAIGANREGAAGNYTAVNRDATDLAAYAATRGVACAIVPMVWKRPARKGTDTSDPGGYIFPFLEARAALGRHEFTQRLADLGTGDVFHRTMDADVTDDPLFDVAPEGGQEFVGRALSHEVTAGKIVTGGYNWDSAGLDDNPMLRDLIGLMNKAEHLVRKAIVDGGMQRALYAPEPNTYVPSYRKAAWDKGLTSDLGDKDSYDRQMGESAQGRKGASGVELIHIPKMAVTKPRKAWLENYKPLAAAMAKADSGQAREEFDKLMLSAHQSFLRTDVVAKTAKAQGAALDGREVDYIDSIIEPIREKLWANIVKLIPKVDEEAVTGGKPD